ncbi:OadG family protein [Mahella australiensis]|jgi:Na+-transporting methylmalonyl-CoA/oxaloacetate decarboxylase gamma subunit|uniref:Membrane protein n=1 Tax=Mahella australiensis (strain DSM 15567 / CIP 107919 / 50-1 BON) TaxID=697281 RepID=F3ZVB2_MAHA5|nr:OadG family protein [Mahella australiensis]AEE95262.1 membrane protein [Mahella australiensis 50-1 BON]
MNMVTEALRVAALGMVGVFAVITIVYGVIKLMVKISQKQ